MDDLGDNALCFAGHALDLRRGCLRRGDREVELRPKGFALLRYLVENADRLVPKDELTQAVWPNIIVTDNSLTRCVSDVRRALRDEEQRIIKTVHRRGYVFTASVSRLLPDVESAVNRFGMPAAGQMSAGPSSAAVRGEHSRDHGESDEVGIGPRAAERRQLTVIACELNGLAALSAQLDPEDLREMTAACHRRCTEIIERHQGVVVRCAGSAVLAYFGFPQAREHEAEQAVQAGLALVEAVPMFPTNGACSLQARIGIATGLVVIGEFGDARTALEQAVVGEAPILAARLQALAEPGAVVISSATSRLTGGLFEYSELGPAALGICAPPLSPRRVLGRSGTESRFEALRAIATPLVGRGEEIALLLRRWDLARAGDGSVVLVSGEPGIGKSRLVQTLLERVNSEPQSRLQLYCSPHHQDSSLYPIVRQLERAAGFRRDDTAEQKLVKLETLLSSWPFDLRSAAPVLASLLSVPTGDRYPALDLTPRQHKEKILRTLLAQIEALAAYQPVLVLYEDIHWSDPTTLELLDLLVDRAATLRILLILTFRAEFVPPRVGRPNVAMLSLSRLPRSERIEMILNITGGKHLPEEISDQITDRTDGVPLFVEELTKAVVESAFLEESGDRYTVSGPVLPLSIPMSLQASLLARLDRLISTREVVQIAAALGREFTHEVIAAVAAMPLQQLDAALTQLVQAELVHRRGTPPDAEYSFKHALVRDAAYSTLLRGPRQELHARIIATLEGRFPETGISQPALLAQHCMEAGLADRAVAYWLAAGQQAQGRSAMHESEVVLRKGLRCLDGLPDNRWRRQQELALTMALLPALRFSKGHSATELGETLTRARALAEQLERTEDLVPLCASQVAFHLELDSESAWLIKAEPSAGKVA